MFHFNKQILLILALGILLSTAMPALAAEADPVKNTITGFLNGFQGKVGDGIVVAAILGLLVALYRKAFKTALGCLVLIGGIVVLRISISLLF